MFRIVYVSCAPAAAISIHTLNFCGSCKISVFNICKKNNNIVFCIFLNCSKTNNKKLNKINKFVSMFWFLLISFTAFQVQLSCYCMELLMLLFSVAVNGSCHQPPTNHLPAIIITSIILIIITIGIINIGIFLDAELQYW